MKTNKKDLNSCLDMIFGMSGEVFIGLEVDAAIEKIEASVYPGISKNELNRFLGMVPNMTIMDSDNKKMGIVSEFHIKDNYFACKVIPEKNKVIDSAIIEFFVAAAIRSAIGEHLAITERMVQIPVTDC